MRRPFLDGRPFVRAILFLSAVLLPAAAASGQTTHTWTTGTSGNWNSTGWTTTVPNQGPPGPADNATINVAGVASTPYTVSVTDARAINNLTLSHTHATLLVSTGSLTVNGTFTLGAGTVNNSGGGLTLNGGFLWIGGTVGGGTVTASAGGTLNGGVVNNATLSLAAGAYTWNTGLISLNNGGVLSIGNGTTVSLDDNHNFGSTGGGIVQNAGVLQKTGGGGGSQIPTGVTLNNSGTWRAAVNGWNIQGGTVNNTGIIDIASGAEVFVNGGTLSLNAGSSVTGPGRIRIDNSGGTLTVNGTVNSSAGLTIVRGQVNGSGTITVGGTFDLGYFDANSLMGLTINAAGGGQWTGSDTPRIGTATVNITGGTVNWSGRPIDFTASGTLTVGPAGTLSLSGNDGFSVDAGFTPTFTVNGLFRKVGGTGTSVISPGFIFSVGAGGVVDGQTGILAVRTNTANAGTIRASTGTVQFDAASTISGAGTIDVQAAGTLTVAPGGANVVTVSGGTLTNAGRANVGGGTFRVLSAVNMTNYTPATSTLSGGLWTITNGTLDLDGRTIGTIATGTTVELTGSGAVTGLTGLTQVNGRLRLVGATLTPPATVNVAGSLEASGLLGTSVVVQNGGVLSGSGVVNGGVTVQSGGRVTPGPGPYDASGIQILETGNLNLNGGSRYTWEINSWATNAGPGNAGNGFDQLRATFAGAKLNLAGASSGDRVTIAITSLNGSLPGQIANFDPAAARSWFIADYSSGNVNGGIQNFAADKFTLDVSAFSNSLTGGSFSITTDAASNRLVLVYTPVPEPGTALLIGGLGLIGIRAVRRRSRRQP